jgi:hypothetical protein
VAQAVRRAAEVLAAAEQAARAMAEAMETAMGEATVTATAEAMATVTATAEAMATATAILEAMETATVEATAEATVEATGTDDQPSRRAMLRDGFASSRQESEKVTISINGQPGIALAAPAFPKTKRCQIIPQRRRYGRLPRAILTGSRGQSGLWPI